MPQTTDQTLSDDAVFSPIDEILDELRNGRMVILTSMD